MKETILNELLRVSDGADEKGELESENAGGPRASNNKNLGEANQMQRDNTGPRFRAQDLKRLLKVGCEFLELLHVACIVVHHKYLP